MLIAEVALDCGGQPGRGHIKGDRTARQTPPQSTKPDGDDKGNSRQANGKSTQQHPMTAVFDPQPAKGARIFPAHAPRLAQLVGGACAFEPIQMQKRFKLAKHGIARARMRLPHSRPVSPRLPTLAAIIADAKIMPARRAVLASRASAKDFINKDILSR
ncbi:MAG TPA: hypothetical protein VNL39_08070 [Xanthobacteraceae bacterium]|nr:hypothetical protein [Xanthobacteraceae bacterium]